MEGLNLPRYPSVPGALRAQRKPVVRRLPERAHRRDSEKLRLVVPEGQGKEAEILGHGPEAAPAVVDAAAADRGAAMSVLVVIERKPDGQSTSSRCRPSRSHAAMPRGEPRHSLIVGRTASRSRACSASTACRRCTSAEHEAFGSATRPRRSRGPSSSVTRAARADAVVAAGHRARQRGDWRTSPQDSTCRSRRTASTHAGRPGRCDASALGRQPARGGAARRHAEAAHRAAARGGGRARSGGDPRSSRSPELSDADRASASSSASRAPAAASRSPRPRSSSRAAAGPGSAEGFGIIEELAGLLGGAVGCSRAVTMAGWRPHTDQVGQTGTKIAPDSTSPAGSPAPRSTWPAARARRRSSRQHRPRGADPGERRLRGDRRPARGRAGDLRRSRARI